MKSSNISLVVTSVLDEDKEKSVAIINSNGIISYKLFDSISNHLALVNPAILDLKNARIGVVNSADVLFPEATMTLSKMGADIILVPSHLEFSESFPINYLNNIIETRSNDLVNIFSSDENNVGIMISNAGGYFDDERILSKATPYSVMKIDTAKVRNKRLNSYYDFDQNGFMINAVINKAKLPTEVVLKLIPKVINPSVYCYVEKPFLLTGGYASYVSFNGIEQKQCENIRTCLESS